MGSVVFWNSLRFVVAVLAQILICNHIDLFGYINPLVYIYFILLFPFNANRSLFLILAFALGLTIDLFSDSGGANAAACVIIAYIRPFVLRFAFGISYEHQSVRLENTAFGQRMVYIIILVFIHHFFLFLLEIFNISNILLTLKNTLFFSIFTILIITLSITLFSRKSS
ncbi:rod shape-determining protein MreD [Kordia sp. YSTF-M3]|uniref:Rod shape-determining protein MreD n=1 Tax=Kordia aestuariivivens TaxID=2759037 RepID=A0ABR7QA09_9FLAO|nr:rod shape-determining protein MreD [Kordia aestuariivivens]MBC8755400.1 rod shape-determining protein MreD [Kordia aestuariivivens]